MKIATWNVNSIRARLEVAVDWLRVAEPDVVLLQETKVSEDQFPGEPIAALGYQIAAVGETTGRNGVAILAREPIETPVRQLPGAPDDGEARWIEAVVRGVRVVSVYVPNGTALGSARFAFKLAFLERMRVHAQALLEQEETLVIGGDYNVAPEPIDVYDPAELDGTICYHPEERARFRTLVNLGLYDAYRLIEPRTVAYSWWHYMGRAFRANQGMRIDHLLLSPQAIDRLDTAGIDAKVRAGKTPSDHVPVWCRLAD